MRRPRSCSAVVNARTGSVPPTDLDDTLVQTSDHDKRAFAKVAELAQQTHPEVDGDKLIADFKVLFKATPWDPEYKVCGPQGHPSLERCVACL